MSIKVLSWLEEKFPSTIGYIYYIIGSLLFAGHEYFIGKSKGIHAFQVNHISSLINVLLSQAALKSQKFQPVPNDAKLNKLIIARSVLSLMSSLLLIYGF